MRSWSAERRRFRLGAVITFATMLASLAAMPAFADYRDQAKKIHDRIAGVPPDETTLAAMADLLDNNNASDDLTAASDGNGCAGVLQRHAEELRRTLDQPRLRASSCR